MNNEKILKKKIEFYLITPIFVSLFLILMCGALYFVDKKCAVIATVAVVLVILVEALVYVVTKRAVMPTLIAFSFEQGQIQKELLKELAIPYALLDTDGKILWGNTLFVEQVGGGSKKRIRKNISAFFCFL